MKDWNNHLFSSFLYHSFGRPFEEQKLQKDLQEERDNHLAIFISRLWQIHVFGEGNTRTTAVFFIKYLRTLKFGLVAFNFIRLWCSLKFFYSSEEKVTLAISIENSWNK